MGSATDLSASAKSLRRGTLGQIAFFGIALGQAIVITVEQMGHQVGEKHPTFPVQPPNNAKIHKRDLAAGIDEHITGVLIPVEETVVKHRLKETGRGVGQDLCEIMPGGAQLVAFIDINAVNTGHNQHALTGQVPERRGRAQPTAFFEVARHFVCGCGFHAQIQLHGGLLSQHVDQTNWLRTAQVRHHPLRPPRAPAQETQFAIKASFDVGTKDFDSDVFPVFQARQVHLRNRRRANRWAKVIKDLIDGTPQSLFQRGPSLRITEGLKLVLQSRKIQRRLLTNQICARGQDLAQLYVGWSQPLQRMREIGPWRAFFGAATFQPAQHPECGRGKAALGRQRQRYVGGTLAAQHPKKIETSERMEQAAQHRLDPPTVMNGDDTA